MLNKITNQSSNNGGLIVSSVAGLDEMPPLKSLIEGHPNIGRNFLHFCARHGILSVEDFLICDLDDLAASAERDPSSEDLKKGITDVLSVIDGMYRPWQNGMEMLEDALQNKLTLSSGFEGIDFLLGGGLREGQVTELVGRSGSGKTQVCLQAASNVSVNHKGTVVYFDTCNSFSTKRIVHMVNNIHCTLVKEMKERNLRSVMSRILCHPVYDLFNLLDVLQQLEFSLEKQKQVKVEGKKIHLLVVDSLSSLVTPILGGRDSNGRSLMIMVGFLLKKLANEHNISVLVTNHMVGGEGGIPKPALGESWKFVPHVRLMLSRNPGSNVHYVSIMKHPSIACGQAEHFSIQVNQNA